MPIEYEDVIDTFKQEIEHINLTASIQKHGHVISVADGIVQAAGIENVEAGAVLRFESGVKGAAMNLENECTSIMLLCKEDMVQQGEQSLEKKR